jgi:hypothetical protein
MNRTIFHLRATLALFAVTSCATSPARTSTSRTVAVTPQAQWTPALKTIPTRGQCRSSAPENRTSCYQILLEDVLKSEGIDSAMAALTSLAATEREVRDNSHMFAHSLGLAAFTTPAELASVFSRCSPGFQSGCYHGVIQAYFLDQHRKSPGTPVGPAEINSLCKDFRAGDGRWLLFQCAHGLGHGLELIYGHDLPRALAGCDLVSDLWERPACYGGAFMENIVAVTNPHQTAEGIAGGMGEMDMEGDMSGMDMSGMDHSDSASHYKKFDPANPLYPCSSLSERYGSQCYLIQTSLILFENHGDFAAASRDCESAPSNFRVECFVSLGRDANSYGGGDPAQAMRSCANAPEAYRPWCHVGVVKNRVDITSHPSDGFSYCAALGENSAKVTCYSAVGEEIRLLTSDLAKRKWMCSAAPPPFDGACLYGAGVIADRPAGLASTPN